MVDVHENAVELVDLMLEGKLDPKDLRKRHEIGVEVEGEHTSDPKKKEKIAGEHEKENPLYYPAKKKPKDKKEALRWVESEGPCPHCHTQYEGRRKELADLGWKTVGWGWDNTDWINPPQSYHVRDHVIDKLPDDVWQLILSRTNARGPEDAGVPPKANVIGDTTTIGVSAGGA